MLLDKAYADHDDEHSSAAHPTGTAHALAIANANANATKSMSKVGAKPQPRSPGDREGPSGPRDAGAGAHNAASDDVAIDVDVSVRSSRGSLGLR